jgi:hypothetical protein
LQNEYRLKKDEISANKLINEWKPFVKLVKKNNRIDAKVNIKELAQFYKKIVK